MTPPRSDNKAYLRAWRARNPKKVARYGLQKKAARYGLTPEQYNKLRAAQQGRCGNPFCKGRAEHMDHQHATGAIRGFLCQKCNMALGLLHEDEGRILGLVAYLKRPPNSPARR